MNTLGKARKVVKNFLFDQKQLDQFTENEESSYFDNTSSQTISFSKITPEIIAKSLAYVINIEESKYSEEALGYSKKNGHPHLPSDWILPSQWKGKYSFLMQINFQEINSFDIDGVLPKTGIAYIFQHKEEGRCMIYYYNGDSESLAVRKDLEPFSEVDEEVRLTFNSGFIFYIGSDAYDYSAASRLIPKKLEEQLKELLKATMLQTDSGFRVFGRPVYWQGEDEYYDEHFGDEPENELNNEEDDNVLLLHMELDDVSIHTWINADALKVADFSQVWQTFSTT